MFDENVAFLDITLRQRQFVKLNGGYSNGKIQLNRCLDMRSMLRHCCFVGDLFPNSPAKHRIGIALRHNHPTTDFRRCKFFRRGQPYGFGIWVVLVHKSVVSRFSQRWRIVIDGAGVPV